MTSVEGLRLIVRRHRDSVRGLVERAAARFGRIDVLVNNAGRGQVGAAEETTEAELMHTVFPHPTLSEMMHESVLDAYGRVLHV